MAESTLYGQHSALDFFLALLERGFVVTVLGRQFRRGDEQALRDAWTWHGQVRPFM